MIRDVSDPRHLLGQRAEDATADWLERAGWRILARRHRSTRGGEVDLVAEDPDGILVAVEVRARRSTRTGAAATTVDGRRVARLGRTLAAFGADSAIRHRGLRVDLVIVEPLGAGGGRWRLRRIAGIG
jgi:Holliday junction resolvase-like predicted endonuclease